jgi:CO/xanthine dehydrogenase Mo-binding subunit
MARVSAVGDTAMTQFAADAWDVPLENVDFEAGDTDMLQAPVRGGSIILASVGDAVPRLA